MKAVFKDNSTSQHRAVESIYTSEPTSNITRLVVGILHFNIEV